MAIDTPDELHAHLRLAMRLELSTVPLYLYALYSIDDQASEAAALIRSVVAEEMLHLALVANLLLAVGGQPDFLDPELPPRYPGTLAYHDPPLTLNLAPATVDHIRDTFLAIEQPDPPGSSAVPGQYDSLGEFYAAIEDAVIRLGAPLFQDPQAQRQLSDPRFYGPIPFNAEASGDLMLIRDVATAQAAIDVIVHQGEGLSDDQWADPGRQEWTHYAKFLRMVDGSSPVGPLRPVRVNPRVASFHPDVRGVAELFNAVYASMFVLLDQLYSERPDKGRLVNRLYGSMTRTLGPIGRLLTTLPLGDGTVASPTFERFDLGDDPAATLRNLAAALLADRPTLQDALKPLLA